MSVGPFYKKKYVFFQPFLYLFVFLFFGFYFDPGSPRSNFRNFVWIIFRKMAGPAAGSRHRARHPDRVTRLPDYLVLPVLSFKGLPSFPLNPAVGLRGEEDPRMQPGAASDPPSVRFCSVRFRFQRSVQSAESGSTSAGPLLSQSNGGVKRKRGKPSKGITIG